MGKGSYLGGSSIVGFRGSFSGTTGNRLKQAIEIDAHLTQKKARKAAQNLAAGSKKKLKNCTNPKKKVAKRGGATQPAGALDQHGAVKLKRNRHRPKLRTQGQSPKKEQVSPAVMLVWARRRVNDLSLEVANARAHLRSLELALEEACSKVAWLERKREQSSKIVVSDEPPASWD